MIFMNNQSKIITALLAGVAVGTVLGLLFSPESGDENREGLAGWVKDVYDSSREKAGVIAERGANALRSVRSQGIVDISDEVERSLGV